MRSRPAMLLTLSALCATSVVGCADGGSSVTQSPGTIPSATQRGTVSGDQASLGRQVHSGVRRTRSVATCSTNGSYAFVGGGGSNVAGGEYSVIGGGSGNQACDDWSTIAGGYYNAVSGSGSDGFIGGGESNVVSGSDTDSAIVAGEANSVSNTESAIVAGSGNSVTAQYSLLGGGQNNTISSEDGFIGGGVANALSGEYGFVGGGHDNTLSGLTAALSGGYENQNAGTNAMLGAGQSNSITSAGDDAFIGGGNGNTVSGTAAVIGGGQGSYAEGAYATVPGGYDNNAAGELSFAAGFKSYARHAGVFVWSDYASGATLLESTGVNQFLARATGGFTLWTNAANTVGAKLAPGSGTWASASDRNLKTDVAQIDDAAVLDKVASLPISRWSYKSERGVRHVGPMAQDFYAAFRVGEDDKHITSIDEDGVALAAIKALHTENAKLRARVDAQAAQFAALRSSTARQLARLQAEIVSTTR